MDKSCKQRILGICSILSGSPEICWEKEVKMLSRSFSRTSIPFLTKAFQPTLWLTKIKSILSGSKSSTASTAHLMSKKSFLALIASTIVGYKLKLSIPIHSRYSPTLLNPWKDSAPLLSTRNTLSFSILPAAPLINHSSSTSPLFQITLELRTNCLWATPQ